jgi:transcription antitermination protein NusB
MIRHETRRRARAFQLLYAWETQGRRPLEDLIQGFARLVRPGPAVLEESAALARGVVDQIVDLDEAIARTAEHWRLERIGLAERLVLRIAIYELRQGVTPPRVAIDQALWLARRFAGEASIPFINGVLDRIARELGLL